jgi:predicted O-methyltransferase YrrM
MIQTISLSSLVDKYWNLNITNIHPTGVDIIDSVRQRESNLLKFLPGQLVRRFDTGFARSCTVHPDTGKALYTICRATKAKHIFETGTYWGYSTAYLAAAVSETDPEGKVYTFDIYSQAGKHIPHSLRSHVELHRGKPSVETMPKVLEQVIPDLFFQDSRHDYEGVTEELNIIVPYLTSKSVILFHDFVVPGVRQAASEGLKGFDLFVLESEDPQQLGVAIKQ